MAIAENRWGCQGLAMLFLSEHELNLTVLPARSGAPQGGPTFFIVLF